jgi:NADH-quinone oxidoreductase subunit L
MLSLLWLVPLLPFLGSLLLIVAGRNLSKSAVAWIGSGSVGISTLIVIAIGGDFLVASTDTFNQSAWQWFDAGGLTPSFAFHLDALSMVFIFVITFVGFLIHVFSVEFMAEDEGFSRYFAYLNLFVCSMLILVLADNLVMLYLGWEGVGLCSYLLIGFWYREDENGYAARKAFIITRVGDTAMGIGLFILFNVFNTLNIQDIATQAPNIWDQGSQMAVIAAFLLLGGAVGKSAQLPLQTWLPDAMAGPSPVSALIHAATMVTAGVYLIARMHVLFELAPIAQFAVGVVGAITLLLAGFSALTQVDLKRVLAYSTISQIGYMFLALGIGAWYASIFHFMIHAFFKALLFLAAGVVIDALHHEHDMFKMGGLKDKLPVVYWTFLVGAASLAALPLLTAGFYSKDQILWLAWAGEKGNAGFFAAALLGAFITSVYTARMVILTFYGEAKTPVGHHPGKLMSIPLVILGVLSIAGGFIELPHTFGHFTLFSDFLSPVLPETLLRVGAEHVEWLFQLVAAIAALSGIYVAYVFYLARPQLHERVKASANGLYLFWRSGWGFDTLYDTLFVRPFVWLTKVNKLDIVDKLYEGLGELAIVFHRLFASTQSGVLRWYVLGIVFGAILIVTLGLML